MGLYDEGDYETSEPSTNESVGKAIASVNKKPLKDKDPKKIPKSSNTFEFPEWLRQSIIYIIAILIIAIIGIFVYFGVQPSYLNTYFSQNPSYIADDSSSTKLNVEVKNINEFDLKNSTLTIAPVDKLSIAVIHSDQKIIPILGAGEKRLFSYDLYTIGIINPGEYTLLITLKTSEETIEKKITWEITNRK